MNTADLKDAFFKKLQLHPFPTDQCSVCGGFSMVTSDGQRPGFDDNCGCSDYNGPIRWRSWSDLEFLLVPENGYLNQIKEFVAAENL